jgi:hypothetical protein
MQKLNLCICGGKNVFLFYMNPILIVINYASRISGSTNFTSFSNDSCQPR